LAINGFTVVERARLQAGFKAQNRGELPGKAVGDAKHSAPNQFGLGTGYAPTHLMIGWGSHIFSALEGARMSPA
jgi:hypothetical protein